MKTGAFLVLAVVLAGAGGAAAQAPSPSLSVSAGSCRALVAHRAVPDAAYKPGVDVRGRPVAPADLGGGSTIRLPETIRIPITVDFAERYGWNWTGIAGEAPLGEVAVRGDRAFWNGRPLGPADQAALEEACRQAGYR